MEGKVTGREKVKVLRGQAFERIVHTLIKSLRIMIGTVLERVTVSQDLHLQEIRRNGQVAVINVTMKGNGQYSLEAKDSKLGAFRKDRGVCSGSINKGQGIVYTHLSPVV